MITNKVIAERIEKHLEQEQKEQESKSITFKAKKLKDREDKGKRRLHDWAAWRTTDATLRSSAHYDGGEVHATGHDHCLLTDFDSLMISVEHAIDSMNPKDKAIIKAVYVMSVHNPADYWCNQFGMCKRSYRRAHKKILHRIGLIK